MVERGMNGMRILLLTQVVVYPADMGPKIKTLQVLKHLATHHTVVYCTFARNAQEIEAADALKGICSRVVALPLIRSHFNTIRFSIESLATGDSFLLRRDHNRAMQAMVRQLIDEEQIEVIHVDQLNMMHFVPSDWSGITILDAHNALWRVLERLYRGTHNPLLRWFLARERRLVRQSEGNACRRAEVVLAVSKQDKQALQEVAGPSVPIEVVPIMIDVTTLELVWQARQPEPMRLFTIGTLFWPPNSEGMLWWLSQGYTCLREACPEIIYDIIGARPPRALRRLALRYSGVHLHGYVADPVPFWKQATALAVPLLSGGGVRVKILEAMAMGVPVISTSIGCEGLDVEDGRHVLIADTPMAFASACAKVLQDPALAQQLAKNARQLMLERYDTRVVLPALDATYQRLSTSK